MRLEQRAHMEGRPELLVRPDRRALQAHRVSLGLRVPRELTGSREPQDQPVPKDKLGHKALRGRRDQPAQGGSLDLRAESGLQVRRVQLGLRVQLELTESLVLLAPLGLMVQLALRELQAPMG